MNDVPGTELPTDDEQLEDDEHEMSGDPAAHVAATPNLPSRSLAPQVVIGLVLLVLAVSEGVSAFGVWIQYASGLTSIDIKGIANWRGFGWMTLLLAIAAVVVIVIDLVQPSTAVKSAVATLFASMAVIGGYFVVQYTWFQQPGNYPSTSGWGAILGLASGVAGLCLATLWIRASPRGPGTDA